MKYEQAFQTDCEIDTQSWHFILECWPSMPHVIGSASAPSPPAPEPRQKDHHHHRHKKAVGKLTSLSLSSIGTVVAQSIHASVMLTPYLSPLGPSRGMSCRPASICDSTITPTIELSPALSCSQISSSTLGWLLWFFEELPSGRAQGIGQSGIRRVGGRCEDAREQSTMIDGCDWGRAFLAAAAAAFTNSDL
jgi:hypothetical protein